MFSKGQSRQTYFQTAKQELQFVKEKVERNFQVSFGTVWYDMKQNQIKHILKAK